MGWKRRRGRKGRRRCSELGIASFATSTSTTSTTRTGQRSAPLHPPIHLSPRRNLDPQRPLLPQEEDLLLRPVACLLRVERDVEVEEELRDDEAHFLPRQVLADAVPRPDAEGLEDGGGVVWVG